LFGTCKDVGRDSLHHQNPAFCWGKTQSHTLISDGLFHNNTVRMQTKEKSLLFSALTSQFIWRGLYQYFSSSWKSLF
jgi:hypothetical protein